ncbi:hypothetical protein LQW54_007306 [Pestalotiopsis sp. IQ-011]
MRPAVVELRDLTRDDVRGLTGLLSRRPDYGIARPSVRWLSRQEEKVEALPKTLLSSKSKLQRLGIQALSKLDKRQSDQDKFLPPRAVLCPSHERLNQFLMREIFLALTNEASGDYMSALREWPGKNPAVCALLTRMDSIHAFWVSRKIFENLFGTAPHDERYVRVESSCEACILAAIGANGRILADLWAWLTVRKDDVKKFNKGAKERGSRRRRRPIYLHRLVDGWIKHLKPEDGDEVRRRAEGVAAELGKIWAAVTKLSEEKHRRARKETHREMRPNKRGSEQLTEAQGRDRGFGIRLPRPNLNDAALQRNMAGLHPISDTHSVYREGTVINDGGTYPGEVVEEFRQLNLDLQGHLVQPQTRPGAPGPARAASVRNPATPATPVFRDPFADQGTPPPQNPYRGYGDDQDETYQHEYDERDYAEEKASVVKVQNWYQQQAMNATHTNLHDLDTESVHPAFATNRSALPSALNLSGNQRAESHQPARAGWERPQKQTNPGSAPPNADARSEWEDASVYTTADAFDSVNLREAPPMPQVPSHYRDIAGGRGDRTPTETISSVPGLSPDRGSTQTTWTEPPSRASGRDPFEYETRQPLVPQAFSTPTPLPRPPQTKADRRKYLFHEDESVAASHLTMTNKRYLRQHKGNIREVPLEMNPFVRKESKRVKRSGGEAVTPISTRPSSSQSQNGRPRFEGYAALNSEVASPTPDGPRSASAQTVRPRFEGYAALNREAEERAGQGAQNRENPEVYPYSPDIDQPPTLRFGSPQNDQWQSGGGGWGDNVSEVRPLDSASNVAWRKDSDAQMTTLGDFIDSHRNPSGKR